MILRLVLALLTAVVSGTLSCSCAPRSIQEHICTAEYLIKGTVTDMRIEFPESMEAWIEDMSQDSEMMEFMRNQHGHRVYTVSIERSFRGDVEEGSQIEISTSSSGSLCGAWLSEGISSLIQFSNYRDQYETSMCQLNRRWEYELDSMVMEQLEAGTFSCDCIPDNSYQGPLCCNDYQYMFTVRQCSEFTTCSQSATAGQCMWDDNQNYEACLNAAGYTLGDDGCVQKKSCPMGAEIRDTTTEQLTCDDMNVRELGFIRRAACVCPDDRPILDLLTDTCVTDFDCTRSPPAVDNDMFGKDMDAPEAVADCPSNQIYYSDSCLPCIQTCGQDIAWCSRICITESCGCPPGKPVLIGDTCFSQSQCQDAIDDMDFGDDDDDDDDDDDEGATSTPATQPTYPMTDPTEPMTDPSVQTTDGEGVYTSYEPDTTTGDMVTEPTTESGPEKTTDWEYSGATVEPTGEVTSDYTGEVHTSDYATGGVQTSDYATGEVKTSDYATGEVKTSNYATGEVKTSDYATGEVQTSEEMTSTYFNKGYTSDKVTNDYSTTEEYVTYNGYTSEKSPTTEEYVTYDGYTSEQPTTQYKVVSAEVTSFTSDDGGSEMATEEGVVEITSNFVTKFGGKTSDYVTNGDYTDPEYSSEPYTGDFTTEENTTGDYTSGEYNTETDMMTSPTDENTEEVPGPPTDCETVAALKLQNPNFAGLMTLEEMCTEDGYYRNKQCDSYQHCYCTDAYGERTLDVYFSMGSGTCIDDGMTFSPVECSNPEMVNVDCAKPDLYCGFMDMPMVGAEDMVCYAGCNCPMDRPFLTDDGRCIAESDCGAPPRWENELQEFLADIDVPLTVLSEESSEECVDLNRNCASWAERSGDLCTTHKYMIKNCKLSCNACPAPLQSETSKTCAQIRADVDAYYEDNMMFGQMEIICDEEDDSQFFGRQCVGSVCFCVDAAGVSNPDFIHSRGFFPNCPGFPECPGDQFYSTCGIVQACGEEEDNEMMCNQGCGCPSDKPFYDEETEMCRSAEFCGLSALDTMEEECRARGEIFTDCMGRNCEVSCDQVVAGGDRPACPMMSSCNPGCECPPGFVRNGETGRCILPDTCPGFSYDLLPTGCWGRYRFFDAFGFSDLPGYPVPHCREDGSYATTQCRGSKCYCSDTLTGEQAYNGLTGELMPMFDIADLGLNERNCDVLSVTNNCQAQGKEYNECGYDCGVTCDNFEEERMCATEQCEAGCFCPSGTLELEDGTCLAFVNCPTWNPPSMPCRAQADYIDRFMGNSGYAGLKSPFCDEDGNFEEVQCEGSVCFCVDTMTGEEIADTEHGRGEAFNCTEQFRLSVANSCAAMGQGMEYTDCVGARCPTTCEGIFGGMEACPMMDSCEPGCQCKLGYLKSADGDCIFADECPQFSEDDMPTNCAARVEFLKATGLFYIPGYPSPNCNDDGNYEADQCHGSGCFCVNQITGERMGDEFHVSELGAKYRDCLILNREMECEEMGKVFKTCGSSCPPSCKDFDQLIACTKECVAGCFCPPGTVIQPDGSCMAANHCPDFSPPENCASKGQYLRMAGLDKLMGYPIPECDEDGNYEVYQCVGSGCFCVDVMTGESTGVEFHIADRLESVGQCIEAAASVECEAMGKVYDSCGSLCPASCENLGESRACAAVCSEGCFCPAGSVIQADGSCMAANHCPEFAPPEKCSEKEQYLRQAGLDNLFGYPIPNCDEDGNYEVSQCVGSGCSCVDVMTGESTGVEFHIADRRESVGQCHELAASVKCEAEGKVYMSCGSSCPLSCENLGKVVACTLQCVAGCFCPQGKALQADGTCAYADECPEFSLPDNCVDRLSYLAEAQLDQLAGYPVPACSEDGNYDYMQCDGSACFCVNPETGEPFNDFIITPEMRVNCEEMYLSSTCTGGQEYNSCASACDSTCEDPMPMCNKMCVARCACPIDAPIWDGENCIAQSACPTETPETVQPTTSSKSTGPAQTQMALVRLYNEKRGYVYVDSRGRVGLTDDESDEGTLFFSYPRTMDDGRMAYMFVSSSYRSDDTFALTQKLKGGTISITVQETDMDASAADMFNTLWYQDSDEEGDDRLYVERKTGKKFYFDFYKGKLTGWKETNKANQKWQLLYSSEDDMLDVIA